MGDYKSKLKKLNSTQIALLNNKLEGLLSSNSTKVDSKKRLVSFVTTDNKDFDVEVLKTTLKNQLPNYMVPDSIIKLDEFNHLPNGKIDIKNLPKQKVFQTNKTNEKSKNSTIEETLITVWEEVLNVKPIHVKDNLFELGGDSILSIQIISNLRKKGYILKANTLFNNQTIKELSFFVKKEGNETVFKEPNGELILTPIQHWFFETHKNTPHFWNQIYEVEIPQTFSNRNIELIILKLIEAHDGLRLGFAKKDELWESKILTHSHDKLLVYKDFSDLKEQNIDTDVEDFIYKQQENYSLTNNYLFRGLIINLKDDRPKKLYLIAHHLIFDQVSKIILLKDFAELYEQTMRNKPLKLIKSPSTYVSYNNKLKQLKDSLSIKNNIEYWKSQVNTNQKFPVDFEVNLPILEFDIDTVILSVDQNLTQNLQNIAKNKNNLIVDEILIASLTKTICEWSNQPEFIMVKENLGRQIDDDYQDFSETIGWLTSINPIKVAYNKILELKSFILDIKETVRTIPNKGLDYGILRYLVEDESIKKSLTHSAPVLFNHLGKMTNSENIYNLEFRNKSDNSRSKLSERNYFFEINTYIENNELKINWSYSKKCHKSETMTNLLSSFNRNLEQIVEFCSKLGNDFYSASDFPDSDLDNDDLNELFSQL